ncbi:MAG: SiaB family protein kinase [Bacteroidales bacterium]
MTGTETIIDYQGSISFKTIERLLDKLRSAREFREMKKPARKRLYSAFVESIDNIYKYAAGNGAGKRSNVRKGVPGKLPSVSVKKQGGQYVITTGNLIRNDDVEDLRFQLDRIRQLDRETLKTLYEDIINRESVEDARGAGLGLVTMALKTEQKIKYNFTPVDNDHSFFEIQITINE